MKKIASIILSILFTSIHAQDKNIEGIPIKGILPIKKVEINSSPQVLLKGVNELPTSLISGSPTGSSSEVGVTEGELSVSLSGGSNYYLPISLPQGINGVVPKIGLIYDSQSGNGNVGYGWNIAGISKISRINSTKFHDGIIDPVDFNDFDRFSLDGQRLIIKRGTSGAYGNNGTVYETENFSNIKVTSYGVTPWSSSGHKGPQYFIVEYPDGSKAKYGGNWNNTSVIDWAIEYWENPQGIRINYTYDTQGGGNIFLKNISYGNVNPSTSNSLTNIEFLYKIRNRFESAYIGGINYTDSKILSEIKIKNNDVGYKNYYLQHDITSLGYERLIKITEKNGDNSASFNPTIFSYDTSSEIITWNDISTTLNVNNLNYNNSATISGDFNGDGSNDILLYPTTGIDARNKYWLFTGINSNSANIGVEHNIGAFKEILATSWIGNNNKLMPMQGWCVVQHNLNSNITSFKNFSAGIVNPINYQYEESFEFPKYQYGYWKQPCTSLKTTSNSENIILKNTLNSIDVGNEPVWVEINKDIPKDFLSGDFNGDGISEIIAIEKSLTIPITNGCTTYNQTIPGGKTYLLKLDSRTTSTEVSVVGNISITSTSKVYIEDVNGDGKSDLMVFDNGFVNVYSVNENNILASANTTTNSNINLSAQILFGDYNGDGKVDFIIPKGGYLYTKFLSNGKDLKFTASDHIYEIPYLANTQNSNVTDVYYIIPNDFNQDGKTDLILAQNKNTRYTIGMGQYQYKGYIAVRSFKNTGTNFVSEMASSTPEQTTIGSFATPVFLNTNKSNFRNEINFITNNRIIHFESQKNFNKDKLLRQITLGNGVRNTINYSSLKNVDSNSYENYDYYPSMYQATYPYFDVVSSSNFQIVSSLEIASNTDYKRQNYNYYGAVSNVEGLGFMGFRSISKTNWFNNDHLPITNVNKFDISKRNALVESVLVLGEINGSLNNFNPSIFISKKVLNYSDQLFANKVFKLKNISSIETNSVENTSVEMNMSYDDFNNPLNIATITKSNGLVEETENTVLNYINNDSPVGGSSYIIGRIESKNSTVTHTNSEGVDAKTSEDLFTYTGNNLTKIKKKRNLTDYIIEDLEYDLFGNIIKKTISASGFNPRISRFEYSLDGKYLIKSFDIEELMTQFNYNPNNGLLISETNPYGLTTSFEYDTWGKKKTIIDYLGKKTFINYASTLSGKYFNIVTTSEEGGYNLSEFDDLGRLIKTSDKNIDGKHSTITTNYDIYGRKKNVSEPYDGLNETASLFNSVLYDVYGRPSTINQSTGKITNINYNGLSSTINDGIKTVITMKNSLGNPISVTDNGGTINYFYDADGNLRKSNFDGNIIKLEYDGWGRKIKMEDPSAGIYEYTYNDFGEILSEKTPKGITNYNYDDFGKLVEKNIEGTTNDTTRSKTIYNYEASSKLLESIVFEDLEDSNHQIDYNFVYDDYKRIEKSTENIRSKAIFEKRFEYDEYGRAYREFYSATNQVDNKSSQKWIENSFLNGYQWQIKDGSTNQVLWQTNEVNARGMLTKGNYGNGISILNTYNSYGFLEQTSHDYFDDGIIVGGQIGAMVNIMTLQNTFNPITGNLNSRTNSLFNTNETFGYDNFDRLIEWAGARRILFNCKFTNTNENFELLNGATFLNGNNKLTVNTNLPNSGVRKQFLENAIAGDKYQIKLTLDDGVVGNGIYQIKASVIEENLNTGAINEYLLGNISDGFYEAEHTVQNSNTKVYLKIVKLENLGGLSSPRTFTIDDCVITKTGGIDKQFYDNKGRITQNQIGNYNYTDIAGSNPKLYRNTSVTTNLESTDYYTKRNVQSVNYNVFKSPVNITENGIDKLSFLYNPFNSRSAMYYGNLEEDKMARPKRKFYSFDGSMEIVYDIGKNSSNFITYVGGDAYSAPVILKSDGALQEYFYLHRDYQGSIVAITNEFAKVVEKRSFDAWGNITSVKNGNNLELESLTILDRGYTGHEHLESVGLINMNGRIYDPKLHRFLQPDNFVQNPFNSQNYNRYSYVLNNPLKYVDPSGEEGELPGQCLECGGGMTNVNQSMLGNALASLANSWDHLGIKDWANKNIGLRQFGDIAKGTGKFLQRNAKSIGKFFERNWNSLFNNGKKQETMYLPATPNFSNHQLTSGWQNEGFQSSDDLGIQILDGTQTVIDVLGLIPGFGEVADGANALIYIARGDYANASLSAAAMIPFAGWGATGTKLALKADNLYDISKAGNLIKDTGKKADYLFKNRSDAMNWSRNKLGHNTTKMYDERGKLIGWSNSNGSVYWGHGDWYKGKGTSTFPHLNYNINGKKGHLFLGNKIKNKGMWDEFENIFGF